MKTNRRILFGKLTVLTLQLMTASLATAVSLSGNATTTKVGNGDDGADLEALTTIKSGPIWDSRKKAVELLERLNVTGVVGLGILIPELKASEMLMVESDARPTVERAGSIEISEDSRQVYARTFAEPYAATRFFPAAAKLSTEQLVALHIHEALHRALPAEIREDENKVAHITLALTSPGASFDRVSSVANLYLKPAALPNVDQRIALGTGTSKVEQEVVLPPKSKSNFVYSADMFGWGGTDSGSGLFSLGIEGSGSLGGYRKVGSTAIEPYFRDSHRVRCRVRSTTSAQLEIVTLFR
ncbi:MAG: hypothetical protein EOP05_09850 [Proteobacteria bacterium]|nr:MAG: hypothetical protein EOP05_09850 [Pseudomonadota bacterium]